MKKVILFLLLGITLSLAGKSQEVNKKYIIDTVWNYPDLSQEKYSASPANVTAIFTVDSAEQHSYMDLIYKSDTIHFVATGVLTSPESQDTIYYMQRYSVMNTKNKKTYKLNLMFYTKSDVLTAIGVIDGMSMSVFSVKDEIKELNQ